MYERFSTSARVAMRLASEEARAWQHEFVGTEHILIGLLAENQGMAARLLGEADLNVDTIRAEMAKLVRPGEAQVTRKYLRHEPRAKRVVERSMERARELQDGYLSSGHVLAGLLADGESFATLTLTNTGVNLAALKAKVEQFLVDRPERFATDDGPTPWVTGPSLLSRVLQRFGRGRKQ
jgi:ATP-dependent Clp protease ATP-binding subunit ClpC